MSSIDPPPGIGKPYPRPVDRLTAPFKRFAEIEGAGGIVLLVFTAVALLWANLGGESYHHFWHTPVAIELGAFQLENSLVHWIDDGLMAIFFFLVGLEIKREVMVGELASLKKAALPLMAALGGMIFPALIYVLFNGTSGESARGWGIPMATDIAFALGVLALLGKRVPPSLFVFLAALAIADDMGAVLVIAIFYTADLNLLWLVYGLIAFLVAVGANMAGARNPITYGIIGVVVWLAFLKSGVHATIAGVLLAMAIPAKQRINLKRFTDYAQFLIDKLRSARNDEKTAFSTNEQMHILQRMENSVELVMTPLQRYEHGLQPWVAWFIMPIFALANAGVEISGGLIDDLTSSIGLGVIAGLVIGKQVGITLFSWLSVKFGLADLPSGVTWKHIYGTAWLGGIGFTMSLFVANLAFGESLLGEESKIGILTASIISGTIGYFILRSIMPKQVTPTNP